MRRQEDRVQKDRDRIDAMSDEELSSGQGRQARIGGTSRPAPSLSQDSRLTLRTALRQLQVALKPALASIARALKGRERLVVLALLGALALIALNAALGSRRTQNAVLLRSFYHEDRVLSLAWSPDGTLLASECSDGTVFIWSNMEGMLLRTLGNNLGAGRANSVAWSPDSTRLAVGSSDHQVRIWRGDDGTLVHTLAGRTADVTSVAWSPVGGVDGTRLASGASDGKVGIWNDASGLLVLELDNTVNVRSLDWSRNGELLAAQGEDGSIRIWRLPDGQQVQTWPAVEDWQHAVSGIAWSPDSTQLAVGHYDGVVHIWRIADRALLRTLRFARWFHWMGWLGESDVDSLSWSPNDRLAVGLQDGTVHVVQATGGPSVAILGTQDRNVWPVQWSRDGTLLASVTDDNIVRIWQVGPN